MQPEWLCFKAHKGFQALMAIGFQAQLGFQALMAMGYQVQLGFQALMAVLIFIVTMT